MKEEKAPEVVGDEKKERVKKNIQQMCPDYNTAKGCLSKDCPFVHECDLCGSALHVNLDCPNHNL